MDREDVEALRSFFEELNPLLAGDESLQGLAERYIEPDCVAELGTMEGTFNGPAGFARYMEGQRDIIDGLRIEPEEFVEAGDQVVMPFHLHGHAKETGLPIEFHYTQVFTMRNRRFARVRMYASKERALAAVDSSR
jgi:ketosteroid isomerase-like protein